MTSELPDAYKSRMDVLRTLRDEFGVLDRDEAKLREEAARVSARLARVTEKKQAVAAAIAVYERDTVEPEQPQLFAAETQSTAAQVINLLTRPPGVSRLEHLVSTTGPSRPVSKVARVRNAVRGHLEQVGSAHRAELLTLLMEQDIMGHEKSPIASLAAYLSEMKDIFEADGRGNFTLRTHASPDLQPEADDRIGSVEAANSGSDPEPALTDHGRELGEQAEKVGGI